MIKAKTFFAALKEFYDDPHRVQKYFKDRRITQNEKKILECWYLIRDGKGDQIVQVLGKMPAQADELVESQRNLILGIAYNNQGYFLQAVDHLKIAESILRKHDLPYYHFVAQSNLFNTYLNLKNRGEMKKALHGMRDIGPQNQRQELIFLIYQMTYFSFCGRYHFAHRQIEAISPKVPQAGENVSIFFVTHWFSHEIRCHNFQRANHVLNEMKKFRKFHFNANFKFMRMMLDHLMADKPLYVYQHDFDNSPMNFHQLKVIQCLEEANPSDAEKHWGELQKIQPGVYGKPFEYHGDPTLFSHCLKRNEKKISKVQLQNAPDMPKEQWLLTILRELDRPVRKEELFRLIWGRADETKDDLNKLKVLISRTREKYQAEIAYKKGCYQLITPARTNVA